MTGFGTCIEDTCFEDRAVSNTGNPYSRCRAHLNANFYARRDAAAAARTSEEQRAYRASRVARTTAWHKKNPNYRTRRRELNPNEGIEYRLNLYFSMTLDEYDVRLASQGGRCAICRRTPEEAGKKRLAVDHDPECCPGQVSCGACVRGLLCFTCNIRIAFFEWFKELSPVIEAYLRKENDDDQEGLTRIG